MPWLWVLRFPAIPGEASASRWHCKPPFRWRWKRAISLSRLLEMTTAMQMILPSTPAFIRTCCVWLRQMTRTSLPSSPTMAKKAWNWWHPVRASLAPTWKTRSMPRSPGLPLELRWWLGRLLCSSAGLEVPQTLCTLWRTFAGCCWRRPRNCRGRRASWATACWMWMLLPAKRCQEWDIPGWWGHGACVVARVAAVCRAYAYAM